MFLDNQITTMNMTILYAVVDGDVLAKSLSVYSLGIVCISNDLGNQ